MKSVLKSACRLLAIAAVTPIWLANMVGGFVACRERVFPGCTQLMSVLPGTPGVYLRWAFYRLTLPRCGRDAFIGFGTLFSHPTAEVGDRVYVGPGCMLGDVTLEEDVLIGSNVSVINGARQHGISRLDVPVREQPGEYPRVVIGRDSWIGDRSVVMADVGRHAVVGAGSVVTKPVEDYAIVAGNPARVIGSRDRLPKDAAASPPELEGVDKENACR